MSMADKGDSVLIVRETTGATTGRPCWLSDTGIVLSVAAATTNIKRDYNVWPKPDDANPTASTTPPDTVLVLPQGARSYVEHEPAAPEGAKYSYKYSARQSASGRDLLETTFWLQNGQKSPCAYRKNGKDITKKSKKA